MKYFSISTVEEAYNQISASTKEKFWGILGILHSIDEIVYPNKYYMVETRKLSQFFENLFTLHDKKVYTSSEEYSFVFSTRWVEVVSRDYLVGKPDITPILVWAYRNHSFPSEISVTELFDRFLQDFHITKEIAKQLFKTSFSDRLTFEDSLYSDNQLLSYFGNAEDSGKTTLKLDKTFVIANAGDLSRGPYFQPLYAALQTFKCLTFYPFKVSDYYDIENNGNRSNNEKNPFNETKTYQVIYYGTPGCGKSHKVKGIVESIYPDENERDEYVFRTTFHPDSDYASFVGCYKPQTGDDGTIKYEFKPQAFTNAYAKAWQKLEKDIYLIIEEINRGNCAQIFGDLFQLLDRKDGVSEYPINADADLRQYLEKEDILGTGHAGIANGKLKLPANLHIIATMNTSDQSLFPMDSAFKRRWAWECVPIDYENADSGKFTITIGGKSYLWHGFLKTVNEQIKKATQSEDKQMGNFFINNDIKERQFIDKVMFYLWNDICKEEYRTTNNFFRNYTDDKKTETVEFTFNELFGSDATTLLAKFMDYLEVTPIKDNSSEIVEETIAETDNE